MEAFTTQDLTHKNGETTHYYEGGSKDGTPLIFIHGWPDIAESWVHQLSHFAKSKYRVIAPDMRGYGGSTSPKDKSAYSLKVLTDELVEFAAALNIEKAVWIGHDWGSGVVSAHAAQHPELFLGLAVLCVPYRTLELGLDFLETRINTDIYPPEEYPHGQFEYMRYYELHHQDSIKSWDDNIERITKALYTPYNPEDYGKPSKVTSTVIRDGGWFGGHPELIPDIPISATFIDEHHYNSLVASHKKHGFFPPTAYYLNHGANAEFAKNEKNGGVLEFPVLYIDAKHDAVCSPTTSPKMGQPQKETVKDLTVTIIDSGHWVQLEKPAETNEALEKWLSEKF